MTSTPRPSRRRYVLLALATLILAADVVVLVAASPWSPAPVARDRSTIAEPEPGSDLSPGGDEDASEPPVVIHVAQGAAVVGAEDADVTVGTLAAGLERADDANREGQAAHVVVHEGVYRESVDLRREPGMTAAPITVEGRGEVVVSGADVFADWVPVGAGTYRHDWPRDWGPFPIPERWSGSYAVEQLERFPVTRRREMVIVDGQPLRQVTERDELAEGDFLVDEAADELLIHSPDGVDPNAVLTEVAIRPVLLALVGRSDVSLSGITFQHAASPFRGRAVVIRESNRITFVDSAVVWNSGGGLGIDRSRDVTLRRVVANHNGISGLGATRVDDLLVEDSQTSHNNWRGWRGAEEVDTHGPFDANFVDFATGQKFTYLGGATFRRHEAVGNRSSGLWFDFDNRNVVIEDSVFVDNATWGVFFEASPGPFEVTRSRFCGGEVGIAISNSTNGTVTDSLLAAAEWFQVVVSGSTERRVLTRAGDGYDLAAEDWSFTGNTFAVTGSAAAIGRRPGSDGWERFAPTLTASDNRYLHADPSEPALFALPDGRIELESWRQRTGQDLGSRAEVGTVTCRGQGQGP